MDRVVSPGVHCHAGSSGCDYPLAIIRQGVSLPIRSIQREWREPGSKHYQVETASGERFKLAFIESSEKWLVTAIHQQHQE